MIQFLFLSLRRNALASAPSTPHVNIYQMCATDAECPWPLDCVCHLFDRRVCCRVEDTASFEPLTVSK